MLLSPIEIEQLAEALANRLCKKLKLGTDEPASLLDVNQVAELLGCSVATVERLTRSGSLPSIKIGRLRRYRPNEIVARPHISVHVGQS